MKSGGWEVHKLWADLWLPNHKLMPSQSNAAVGQENVFVASLIDANTKWWNVDKVKRTLNSL